MSFQGSVSDWIDRTKAGCESAAARLWGRYHAKLLELARGKLNGVTCRVADEEDVVAAAFQSFLRRTREGSYPLLRDRSDLWRLLATITAHKAVNLIRNERCQKRGGGRVVNVPMVPGSPRSLIHEALANASSSKSNPQICVMVEDSLEHLMTLLGDDELREIAVAKLHGRSNEEIAHAIQRSVPTVERRLRLIRDAWRQELLD